MSQGTGVAILYDELGNPVSVLKDGIVYRLAVEDVRLYAMLSEMAERLMEIRDLLAS